MKLKELEGKIIVRSAPRVYKEHLVNFMSQGVTQIPKVDRSYMCYEIKLLKVTEGLAYITDKFEEKELTGKDISILSLSEYDDGFWELSAKKEILNPNSINFIKSL